MSSETEDLPELTIPEAPEEPREGATLAGLPGDRYQTVARLAQHGIKPDSGPRLGKDGNVQAWIRDPDGNRIELMQRLSK